MKKWVETVQFNVEHLNKNIDPQRWAEMALHEEYKWAADDLFEGDEPFKIDGLVAKIVAIAPDFEPASIVDWAEDSIPDLDDEQNEKLAAWLARVTNAIRGKTKGAKSKANPKAKTKPVAKLSIPEPQDQKAHTVERMGPRGPSPNLQNSAVPRLTEPEQKLIEAFIKFIHTQKLDENCNKGQMSEQCEEFIRAAIKKWNKKGGNKNKPANWAAIDIPANDKKEPAKEKKKRRSKQEIDADNAEKEKKKKEKAQEKAQEKADKAAEKEKKKKEKAQEKAAEKEKRKNEKAAKLKQVEVEGEEVGEEGDEGEVVGEEGDEGDEGDE
jgi:hypothetical protein